MLGFHGERGRLLIAQLVAGPQPIKQVETQVPAQRILDDLAVTLAGPRGADLHRAQDIGVESLAEQLNLAERRNPAYLLIMGRKEALEHSAILRNRTTQEEIIVPVEGLADRLRAFA